MASRARAPIKGSAAYYDDNKYRMFLKRPLFAGPGQRPITVLMHRPSTATASKDDATVGNTTRILKDHGDRSERFHHYRLVNSTSRSHGIVDPRLPVIIALGRTKDKEEVPRARQTLQALRAAGFGEIYAFTDKNIKYCVLPFPTRMSKSATLVRFDEALITAAERNFAAKRAKANAKGKARSAFLRARKKILKEAASKARLRIARLRAAQEARG